MGLVGFVDWTDPTTSELNEEVEDDISSLAIGFSTWMRKRAASSLGETTLSSKVLGRKRPKRFGLDEEA